MNSILKLIFRDKMEDFEKISNEKGNWYLAEIIEKCEPIGKNENQDLRRVTTWGNLHLIKANSPEEAYEKAIIIGKNSEFTKYDSVKGIEVAWVFVGIRDLIPIYEDIEDGAEIMWTDYGSISNRTTLKMVYSKEDLLKNIKPK